MEFQAELFVTSLMQKSSVQLLGPKYRTFYRQWSVAKGFNFFYFTSGFYLPVALILKQALLEALVEVVDIVVDVGVVVVAVDF